VIQLPLPTALLGSAAFFPIPHLRKLYHRKLLTILHKVFRTEYTKMMGSIQQKATILNDTECPGNASLQYGKNLKLI
jgi:hypothetical protein